MSHCKVNGYTIFLLVKISEWLNILFISPINGHMHKLTKINYRKNLCHSKTHIDTNQLVIQDNWRYTQYVRVASGLRKGANFRACANCKHTKRPPVTRSQSSWRRRIGRTSLEHWKYIRECRDLEWSVSWSAS